MSARFAWILSFLVAGGLLLTALAPAADETAPHPLVAVTLKGHSETVYAISFTPDGKYVLTGSFDHSLKMWDTATGKEVRTFGGPQGHQKLVTCLSVSPDGQTLASGSDDNTLKLWDLPSTSPLREIINPDAVNGVALSADGTKLAAACKDGTVQLWNTADGKPLRVMKGGHTGPVTSVAFSSNGQVLASCGSDRQVCFWNPADGKLLAALLGHGGPATSVGFNPANAAQAYSGGEDGVLKFWQVPPAASRALPAHADAVTALTLSADGNTVLSAGADKTVIVSAFGNGQQQRQLTGANAAIQSLAIAPNGNTIAAGTADRRVFHWGNDGKLLHQAIAHASAVTAVAISPQNNQLLTAGQDGLLKLWSLPPVPTRTLPHPDGVLSVYLTADAKRMITGSNDKMVRSWNLTNNQMERQFTGHTGPVTAVALSPKGDMLASGGDDTIRFWNQGNGQQTEVIGAHSAPLTSLSFNPNNQQLLSSSEDGTIKLWQLPVAAPKVMAHGDQVTCAVLSPDGNKLLTGCADKQAHIWNLANGQKERDLPGNTLAVNCVAWSGNGATVAAGGADKSIILWAAADGKEQKRIANVPAAVHCLAFNPAGTQIIAGLADNSVHVYDVAKGTEVKALTGHTAPVTAVVFTPKGDEVLTASADKTILRWNAADFAAKGKIESGGPIASLAVDKDAAKVAAAGPDKVVRLFTLAEGKPAGTITTPAEIKSISFSPDGARIAVAGADNRARIYQVDGTLLEYFPHEGPVTTVAWRVGGKNLVTASADKTARSWTSRLVWLARHAGPVRQAAFSPKGDRILSGSDDKTVKIWNAADGKEVKSIAAHDGPVIGVGISADGAKCASAGADKTAKVWSTAPAQPGEKPLAAVTLPTAPQAVALSPAGTRLAVSYPDKAGNPVGVYDAVTGKEIASLAENTGPVPALVFHSDNRTICTGSADKSARLLDVGVLAVFEVHPGGVVGAAYHSNGTQALTAGADKTVKLWDLTNGKELKKFGPLTDSITSVTFNRDYTQVAATAGKVAKVWNLADGKELLTLAHPAPVVSLSFSVDKGKIATGAADDIVRVWEVASGKELQAFRQGAEGTVRGVVFHPNNTAIVAGSSDKTVSVHALSVTRAIQVGSPIRALAAVPAGTHVLTACDDKSVKLWNVAKGANERAFAGALGAVNAVAVSKNAALVAAAGADQQVRLYTLADAKLIAAIKASEPVKSLAFSPNNLMLVSGGDQKTVEAWNVAFTAGQPVPAEFGKPIQSFSHAGAVTNVAVAPDNGTIWSGSADKSVKAWRLAASQPTASLPHPQRVDSVAFSPNGQMLATGCPDGQLRIFDVAKKAVAKTIPAHTATKPQPRGFAIYCLAWSPDSKQVVTGSEDHSLKLWDAAAGTLVKEFKGHDAKDFPKGHSDSVFAVAFVPDGKTIYSGSADHTIKVWNTADGTVTRELVNPALTTREGQPPQAQPGWITGLRFTADGKFLVSVGNAPPYRGYLSVWNVADGKPLYSEALPIGQINSVAIAPDAKLIGIACSPQRGVFQQVDSYLLKMPDAVK